MKQSGSSQVGRAVRAGLGQEQEAVVGDRLVQRRAVFLPVGNQLVERARVHDRAGQDVRAGLRALLEHARPRLLALLGGELLQADRRGQAGRAAADDDDVVFHRFARAVLGEDFFGVMDAPLSVRMLVSAIAYCQRGAAAATDARQLARSSIS